MARYLTSLSDRPPALTTNDYHVLRAAVCAGVGASILSEGEAAGLGLVRVPVSLPGEARMPLFLVVHRALRHVPRVAVVIDAVEALVAEAR
jgi:DNA-binding transcriptional LysR family regulator